MKHPALLDPVAVEDIAFAADGGLILYLTVPKAILEALLLPPVVCCVGCVCVCVDVDATIVVVADIPLPVPPEVEASGLTGVGAVVSSPVVGGFMAIAQSVRCGFVPFARFRVGIASGRGLLLGSFSVSVSVQVSWSGFLSK